MTEVQKILQSFKGDAHPQRNIGQVIFVINIKCLNLLVFSKWICS